MAYSGLVETKDKKNFKNVKPYWIRGSGSKSVRNTNPNNYFLTLIYIILILEYY